MFIPNHAAPAARGEETPAPPKPDWRRRWIVVRAALGFCAAVIFYAVAFGPDDRLRETAVTGAFAFAGAVALGYLGFAVQDDRNWLRAASGRAQKEEKR